MTGPLDHAPREFKSHCCSQESHRPESAGLALGYSGAEEKRIR